ncbi:hypothetical protein [Sporosarcina limicola]|uniref:Uncharacterized protein n=1 Tax=Sporosarcina limicola TaxID=34101 RepID=A0A927R4S7_9BACL|nr:hypothetical protein [Sporosarcina limicola]MBE1556546.1 hypothetical protein [Sporosarcina limicola]
MKLGSKEYYVNAFKDGLMINYVAPKSQSLESIYIYHEEQIREIPHLKDEEKCSYSRNLQKAYDQTVDEIVGHSEE